ncbi:MAG: LacI family DNA-binding transcriptional regulator [Actinomycetaceae bacterium]|nr:LacI family DNA-binding transcriptional regulator [Actinomycetaceae bacterium]
MRRPTLRDIAQATGTSISTVSLALRDDRRITPAVRKKIQDKASDMGYKVDLLGVMLRTNNPKVIGVAGCFDQELHSAYSQQIIDLAASKGYRVITENVSHYGDYTAAMTALKEFRVEHTIVINPRYFHDEIRDDLLPTVVIGQVAPTSRCSVVTSDNTVGMRELAQHLHTLGHRRIIYFNGPKGISSSFRRDALLTAAQQRDIAVQVIPAGDNIDAGYQALNQLVADTWKDSGSSVVLGAGLGRATAIVCYNDQCAQGVAVGLLRAGITIPHQMSLVGFDNSELASSTAFHLTSIDRDVPAVARLALDFVIEKIERGSNPGRVTTKGAGSSGSGRGVSVSNTGRHVRVPTKLVIRSSTGLATYLNSPVRKV